MSKSQALLTIFYKNILKMSIFSPKFAVLIEQSFYFVQKCNFVQKKLRSQKIKKIARNLAKFWFYLICLNLLFLIFRFLDFQFNLP